ncbi:DUF192 domain-containing protein [Candidatus Beckwithbacteria bacterium]|nr:DUF192 domain-containing protein [Candidatus Beckwithbacteria bacterium]
MQVQNISQKQILVSNLIQAKDLLTKTRGLIGKKKGEALYFTSRFGIHSFGMTYPLFVLVCDDQLTVRKIVANFKPNSLLFWNPAWQHIFELPAEKYQVQIGDRLQIK